MNNQERLGKTWEQIFGAEKAAQMKSIASLNNKKRVSSKKGKTWEQLYGIDKAAQMKLSKSISAKKQMAWRIGKTLEEIWGPEKGKQIKESFLQAAYKVSQRIKGKTYEEIYGEKAEERRLNSAAKNPIRGTFEERYGKNKAEKIKLKISMSQFGKKRPNQLGKKISQETRRKISYTLRLKNTDKPRIEDIIKSEKYKLWRKAVFERDNYTCQECGIKGGYLHAHHIKPKSLYPELMFDVNNGKTYCKKCHFNDKHKGIPKVNNRKFNV